MDQELTIGDRVVVKAKNPGGSTRTPFFIRGKKGVIVLSHGFAANPRDLSYGSRNPPMMHLYSVSFHMAHLYDEDPDVVHDRVIVDVWDDWLDPVPPKEVEGPPLDREEHELSYYDRRAVAVQNLLTSKGLMNIDESRRLVAEFDFQKKGALHPMVNPDE